MVPFIVHRFPSVPLSPIYSINLLFTCSSSYECWSYFSRFLFIWSLFLFISSLSTKFTVSYPLNPLIPSIIGRQGAPLIRSMLFYRVVYCFLNGPPNPSNSSIIELSVEEGKISILLAQLVLLPAIPKPKDAENQ